ncbi:fluoride efflux transporter CrcB [Streptantibioticus parmotrematis]|uniref:fluoride efflux transporter CrcB n=1 Tax=Streptantibioticus parmotrematis TaxID=2873249 RepID=UPI0033D45164
MPVVLVFVGGLVGAPLRYLLDKLVQARHDSVFPWGTFAINITGAFVLGALTAAAATHGLPSNGTLLLGTGICGAFTTFSTFGFETMRLLEDGSLAEAGINALGSLVLGTLAAVAGYALLAWL